MHLLLRTSCLVDQNSAKAANINVAPKLSLNATLSSIADRKSMPFTYCCSLVVGTMLTPLEAANYPYCKTFVLSLSAPSEAERTCTPITINPIKNASVFENVETASPPTKPIITEYHQLSVLLPTVFLSYCCNIAPYSIHLPNILPLEICLYAAGFGRPFFTTGTCASREYVRKLSEPRREALSQRSGLRICW